jgi:hypothetical protein
MKKMSARVFSWLAVSCVAWSLQAQEAPRHVAIQVRETAGIRRFGYPVTAQILLPPKSIQDPRQARLVNADGKPVPAQMTAFGKQTDGSIERLEVDFNLSPGPLETTKLKLEYGADVTRVEPKQGLTFMETEETYQVSAYTIRKDAQPLISSVRYGREYLKQGGLDVVAWGGDAEHRLRSAERKWTVQKKGPFQVRLVCEGRYLSQGTAAALPFELVLEFVSSKSWVGLHYHTLTSADAVQPTALAVVGEFQLTGRLLWDLDVDYWLYGVLESSEQMTMVQRANDWLCRLGKAGHEIPYAARTVDGAQTQGWGHFQEARENGNVVAYGFYGGTPKDEQSLTLTGEGKLQYRRNLSDPRVASIHAFFHFIPVPAQHTARTSPAAMMKPLQVTYPEP